MSKAHYDTYDYPAYWKGRDYEHESEVIALNRIFTKLPHVQTLADIGAGYGRLTPHYIHKAEKVYLVEPSKNLLNVAKETHKELLPKAFIEYIHSPLEDIDTHFSKESLDALLMVRVMHHMSDPKEAIKRLKKLLKKNGFLVLEFANKVHGKAVFKSICCGDFTFPIDLTSSDRRGAQNKSTKVIPFYNYHPDLILETLKTEGFDILNKLSVSNVRSGILKKYIPFQTLLTIENLMQSSFSSINFGPSIFVLAQKRG